MMRFDCDDRAMRRGWKMMARAGRGWGGERGDGFPFGAQAIFGGDGPFGPEGPFGPQGPFGPGGPWGPGGGGRFKGMGRGRGRQFGRAELRLLSLSLIAEQPRHGYDLIKALEEASGGHYSPSPGVIYPALSMLADEGLIAEQASDDQRRKFAITDAGKALLAEDAEAVSQARTRLEGLGERAERHRSPPVQRAAANLFTAVGQRMAAGSGDPELAHRIAEVLDEAAQRIERL